MFRRKIIALFFVFLRLFVGSGNLYRGKGLLFLNLKKQRGVILFPVRVVAKKRVIFL